MHGKRQLDRSEEGQALLELALAMPVVLLLLAALIDAGLNILAGQSALSAADSIARQIEASPGMTQGEAQAYLESNYPNLTGASVTVSAPARVAEPLASGYKVWVESEGAFKSRPADIGWDRREVTVTYEGTWTTPVTIAASEVVVGSSHYTVAQSATAINDATFETW